MERTQFDKNMQTIQTFLQSWQNCTARLWEYSVSHRGLSLRLEKEGSQENLHIRACDLSHIFSPWAWPNACIEISHHIDSCEYTDEPYYLIQDTKANVKIYVGTVNVSENCKPIYTATQIFKR